ncbi:hypothetical protein [Frigoribacterium endophyticum]|uniref:hypothetical protein n=1 Tax=Frigoribacterium endophyticum TaxID=1522176 RepID=UPI00142297CE|nr:hypothetical protein [Frigoribacterium endophyticum]NII52122.1 hypothetical protein [Frigoribacterium endophyticum]
MALSNFPYDDNAIVDGANAVTALSQQVSGVTVDFLTNDVSDASTATVTATLTWVISASDAVAILDNARLTPATPPAPQ